MAVTNNAYFMHCLPVRRNMIVTDDVIESPQSIVIPEAANREISATVVLKRLLGRTEITPKNKVLINQHFIFLFLYLLPPIIKSLIKLKDFISASRSKLPQHFLLRFPLRQYTATGLSFCNKESAIEAKESSITLMLIVFVICPSEYSASVRTSRRCISSF